jgi:hypothetical protein
MIVESFLGAARNKRKSKHIAGPEVWRSVNRVDAAFKEVKEHPSIIFLTNLMSYGADKSNHKKVESWHHRNGCIFLLSSSECYNKHAQTKTQNN